MNKDVEKLLKNAEHTIVLTNKGMYLNANEPAILTLLNMFAEQVIEDTNLDKEDLIKAINDVGKDTKQLLTETLEMFKELLEDYKNNIEKEKEE